MIYRHFQWRELVDSSAPAAQVLGFLAWAALAKPLGFASYADSATGSSGRQGKALVSLRLAVDDRPVIFT